MNLQSSRPADDLTPVSTVLSDAFDLCARKTRMNIKKLADDPKSAAWAVDGNYFEFPEGFYDIGNWTSSFFTGMALIAWQETEDEYFLKQVQRLTPHYIAKVFTHHRDTMHDLGFLYSLFSVALYNLTGDKVYRDVSLRAAELLARRFNSTGSFIRAWGCADAREFADMAIIDCMMNLPLLHWAARQSGDKKFDEIAVSHADTTLKVFIRPDNSVYHAYRFDRETGLPARGDSYGGCTAESHWARGTAWAIYGFALSYQYTRDAKYLDASIRLAKKFVSLLDEEIIPLWDFKPSPDTPLIRDASAAAVAVCGFQQMEKHHAADTQILNFKKKLLHRLCSRDYLNFDDRCAGVQRNGQVGNGIPGGAQNAYTSWGDYFLMEALAREQFGFAGWW
ncbi:MAG TPA: glycoside hydrolase family 88 protein [Verrucomicrobiae bacterium]|nr:glycoside hydrolase family 88 protein [Verrucomicrobiae bacterium]